MEKLKVAPRDSFFDNFRAILIYLVVLCHLISPLAQFFSIKFIYRFCYIFHMPAMLFISGYFFKSSVKDGKLVKDKVFNNLLLYLIFQILFTIINEASYSFYQSQFGLWYIQVLIIYALVVPVLDRVNNKWCLVLCFVAGLFIGVDKSAGHIASLSRLLVFLPFFMIGYYLSNDWVEKFKEKKKIIIGILALVASCVVYYVFYDAFPQILNMSSGKASYSVMRFSAFEGMAWRMLWYVAAILLTVVFATITPKRKTIFSYVGKNSLSVFIIHLPLCVLLRNLGFYEYFKDMDEALVLPIFLALTAVITFVAGSKIAYWPFERIMSIKFKGILKNAK